MTTRRRAVILGGGMAGLTAAWELSRGDWRREWESITVYQRGWRLGGKGASSRGPHGRIEEHGLHVLLGYYDASFRVLREVYAELDRSATDPGCPLLTWREALQPSGDVGLADHDGRAGHDSGADGKWASFVTRFTGNDALPGEPGAEDRPVRPLVVAQRGLQLLWDFHRCLDPASPSPDEPGVRLSASPRPRRSRAGVAALVQGGGLTALAVLLAAVQRADGAAAGARLGAETATAATTVLRGWRDGVRAAVLADAAARRTWQLIDLVVVNLIGMAADGLLSGRDYADLDDLDYREWLARHGAAPETLDSAIVRGMYDLTFAYEGGDKSRPRFAAGLGLQLAARMLFDFKGSIFWRMQAGMGEVVFAPMYQALRARGVRFEFFHRLDRLEVAGRRIRAVHLTRQAEPALGAPDYEPLIRVGGLPCWPDRPLAEQLRCDPGTGCETHGADGPGIGPVTLTAGRDFDVAVLAVSLGMVPHVAEELIAADPAWRRMVQQVATVGTRAAQLWFTASAAEMGWHGPAGVTLSGFGDTFDTWAAMPQLLPHESWPQPGEPRSLAYLCSALPDTDPRSAPAQVRSTLERFLERESGALWPGAHGPDGFRWDLLWDDRGRTGADRLDAAYLRANLDPSDRYVQSLPGSGRHRIAPGHTGFTNLAVAGDWTDCGLNAGCLEAATRSGVLAARAAPALAVPR